MLLILTYTLLIPLLPLPASTSTPPITNNPVISELSNRFPKATIVSVEPSKGNYDIMRQNTRIFRNVIPVHAALWNKVTMLAMTKGQRTPNALEWGFMVQPKEEVRPTTTKIIRIKKEGQREFKKWCYVGFT